MKLDKQPEVSTWSNNGKCVLWAVKKGPKSPGAKQNIRVNHAGPWLADGTSYFHQNDAKQLSGDLQLKKYVMTSIKLSFWCIYWN